MILLFLNFLDYYVNAFLFQVSKNNENSISSSNSDKNNKTSRTHNETTNKNNPVSQILMPT